MPSREVSSRPHPLLVVAPPSAERGELYAGLQKGAGFRVTFAASVAEAVRALEERSAALLITAPELSAAAVTELLIAREKLRSRLPVLVIRDRRAEEPAAWEGEGVGVLRRPLLPDALGRSVEVVLGMRAS